ncbi:DMT family transporter [Thioclava sp. FR2]|uniref:DMT family transporter n=1 Tax=Thioclava sp. FR2 TaxID=3445780 RepID=UPI003EC144C5
MQKDRLDGFGAVSLIGVTLLLAVNQVIVVEVNKGLQPVFFAGLRSAMSVFAVGLWMWWRGRPPVFRSQDIVPGLLVGAVFAAEFLCLFLALDLTTLGRASVIFYSMPLWLALMAHFGLPGQRITRIKAIGLVIAFMGTAIAILARSDGTGGSLIGDLLALGAALGWAGAAFLARKTSLSEVGPEMQLFWMVLVSGPILLAVSPLFGELVRAITFYHILGLLFQSTAVIAGGFIFWLWLLSVYPTAIVASFSFLTPVFSLGFGVLLYGEHVTLPILFSATLVGMGIALINRRSAATGAREIKSKT